MESVYTARYPGFESLSLRHYIPARLPATITTSLTSSNAAKLLAALGKLLAPRMIPWCGRRFPTAISPKSSRRREHGPGHGRCLSLRLSQLRRVGYFGVRFGKMRVPLKQAPGARGLSGCPVFPWNSVATGFVGPYPSLSISLISAATRGRAAHPTHEAGTALEGARHAHFPPRRIGGWVSHFRGKAEKSGGPAGSDCFSAVSQSGSPAVSATPVPA